MLPPPADRSKLCAVLDQLTASVEDLLLGGLTTATEATRQSLAMAIQEAARFRLLRLGSSLRATSDELGRFLGSDSSFSRRRLTFFLNRSWLLGRGIAHAVVSNNEPEYDRLAWTPPTCPIPYVEVVCLGVSKKVSAGSFVAFEFRLRAIRNSMPVRMGQRLTWSVVFPVKPGAAIPPEGFLHLAQKQKFVPNLFLERNAILIRDAMLSEDDSGGGRIVMAEGSRVTASASYHDWEQFLAWSPTPALERLARHTPGPLDLETELQEEVVLRDYVIGPSEPGQEPGQSVYPVTANSLELRALVGGDVEGTALRQALESLRKARSKRPPLFGLMHYERCRLAFQPLAVFPADGPDYLTISKDIINKAALLKALSFS